MLHSFLCLSFTSFFLLVFVLDVCCCIAKLLVDQLYLDTEGNGLNPKSNYEKVNPWIVYN